ncbi:MAG TPA: hypothetical protein VF045_04820, partial [Acidimicrobiales bacterium]
GTAALLAVAYSLSGSGTAALLAAVVFELAAVDFELVRAPQPVAATRPSAGPRAVDSSLELSIAQS